MRTFNEHTGAALVESVLTVGIVLMLTTGMIDFSLYLWRHSFLSHILYERSQTIYPCFEDIDSTAEFFNDINSRAGTVGVHFELDDMRLKHYQVVGTGTYAVSLSLLWKINCIYCSFFDKKPTAIISTEFLAERCSDGNYSA